MDHVVSSYSREAALIALQFLQVLFLLVHDWVPLGRLNDVAAVLSQDTRARLVRVTAIQTLPFAFGLVCSIVFVHASVPHWLYDYLLISYTVLLFGQLRAWWLPYLFSPDPVRAERYRIMFGSTHSFLPERNGLVPNTAHILLHVATFATLCVLLIR